eukprot:185651_1
MAMTVICPSNSGECDADCAGDHGCDGMHFIAANNSDDAVSINCRQTSACLNAIIDARNAALLKVYDCEPADACIGITVYCPENVDGTKKCTIYGDNSMGGIVSNPITFYAVNGWDDITFTASTSNRYGTMHCKNDYSSNCSIASGSGSGAWTCDASGDLTCNFLPTSDPTTAIPATATPTTATPTTSNPTTSQPTAIPTQHPTTSDPTTHEPTTSYPTTLTPSSTPTTSIPTTPTPTTSNPTTAAPTESPSSSHPTTVQPTNTPTIIPTKNPTTKPIHTYTPTDDGGSVGDDTTTSTPQSTILGDTNNAKNEDDSFWDVIFIGVGIISLCILCLICLTVRKCTKDSKINKNSIDHKNGIMMTTPSSLKSLGETKGRSNSNHEHNEKLQNGVNQIEHNNVNTININNDGFIMEDIDTESSDDSILNIRATAG